MAARAPRNSHLRTVLWARDTHFFPWRSAWSAARASARAVALTRGVFKPTLVEPQWLRAVQDLSGKAAKTSNMRRELLARTRGRLEEILEPALDLAGDALDSGAS